MLGYTEYCDYNGVAPDPQCLLTKSSADTFEIEVDDFNSCGISTVYKSSEDYVSVNLV